MAHPFPIKRTCPVAPPDEYAALRAEAPLVRAQSPGGPLWLVTRHAEARQVLIDPTVSTSPATPGHPQNLMRTAPPPGEEGESEGIGGAEAGFFIDMDPPEHTRFRRLLIPEFTVRKIKTMRPGIQRIVDALIDDMLAAGDRADLVEAFGLPVPSLVICQLLGVPYEEREFFQSRTRTMVRDIEDPERGAAVNRAMQEIAEFLSGLVTAAEKSPGDDLLGVLVSSGELSHQEIVGAIFLLLVAGHETTANMIPLSVLTLLRHPDQLQELKADPELWPAAVEELLRYHSIVDWIAFDRVATRDLVVGGQEVKAGEAIFVLGASANRDERAFERPDEFDIHRDSRHHVAFGHGVHQCLGQNLARAELEIALRTLFTRIPDLRVEAADEELSFKYDAAVFGLYELPVAW
ncbi:cytochrome P450 [Thermopolyspora sp. NPDC052614]|uniref:cytochrome P450 n=1 Tax=Thermopolyspora sp. NPDC052614 TaxID=3155682 RepID=UPI0034409C61